MSGGRTPIPVEDRLFAKTTEVEGGCWEWTGRKNHGGYGLISTLSGNRSVHRVAWECFFGEIPEGLEIDHLCFNRACVNPWHLDVVTHLINCRRGRTNQNHGSETCKRGHRFDTESTYVDPQGYRVCRICSRARNREYSARKKAAS